MIELINALQANGWVPLIIVALIAAILIWRVNALWAVNSAAADMRSKEHELKKISTSNAVTKIEHTPY